jgi:histidinol-phosphate aminotransferase
VRRLLLQHPDSVVVIDEAYIDFGGKSAVTLVPEFENLLVIQTLSKSRSLAGLRVGAAFGHADLVEALVRIKDSFNSYPLDVVAQRAAAASLEDDAWFDQCRARVMKSRERLAAALGSRGFRVLPSAANFLFASHGSRPAAELFRELRERQVIVRYFDRPRINNFLRISIGTEEECDALLAALDEIL